MLFKLPVIGIFLTYLLVTTHVFLSWYHLKKSQLMWVVSVNRLVVVSVAVVTVDSGSHHVDTFPDLMEFAALPRDQNYFTLYRTFTSSSPGISLFLRENVISYGSITN